MITDNAPKEAAPDFAKGLTTVHIELFMKLMNEYKMDSMSIGNLELKKSHHTYDLPKEKGSDMAMTDEDLLYHSAS